LLSLYTQDVTDEGVRALAEMESLRKLLLRAPKVTDRGVTILSQSSRLEHLNLIDTKITNQGMESLGKLKNLVQLEITGQLVGDKEPPRITDKGLQPIARLPKLERLFLHCSGISDQGLAQLGGLTGLRDLHVACPNPAYTLQGVKDLQARLPKLSVTHSAWEPTWQPAANEAPSPVVYFRSGPKRQQ